MLSNGKRLLRLGGRGRLLHPDATNLQNKLMFTETSYNNTGLKLQIMELQYSVSYFHFLFLVLDGLGKLKNANELMFTI